MRRTLQRILLPLTVLLLLSITLLQPNGLQIAWTNPDTFIGKVVGVSDGDTIKVIRQGRAVKLRLHGIDCPERKQPYGTRAKGFTPDMAFGREVTVRIKATDRYGRIVGEVILPDGSSLNKV